MAMTFIQQGEKIIKPIKQTIMTRENYLIEIAKLKHLEEVDIELIEAMKQLYKKESNLMECQWAERLVGVTDFLIYKQKIKSDAASN
jgi:hypothetical protein